MRPGFDSLDFIQVDIFYGNDWCKCTLVKAAVKTRLQGTAGLPEGGMETVSQQGSTANAETEVHPWLHSW